MEVRIERPGIDQINIAAEDAEFLQDHIESLQTFNIAILLKDAKPGKMNENMYEGQVTYSQRLNSRFESLINRFERSQNVEIYNFTYGMSRRLGHKWFSSTTYSDPVLINSILYPQSCAGLAS